jgi:hypothetical protein
MVSPVNGALLREGCLPKLQPRTNDQQYLPKMVAGQVDQALHNIEKCVRKIRFSFFEFKQADILKIDRASSSALGCDQILLFYNVWVDYQ